MKPKIFSLIGLAAGLCLLFSAAVPAAGMPPTVNLPASNPAYSTWECWDDGTLNPCRNILTSVSMVSASDGWAVGYGGLVLRWIGDHWSRILVPAIGAIDLSGVYMRSADDGWIKSWQGVWRWNGANWLPVSLPPGVFTLSPIRPLAADNAWALSSAGDIYHWDGGSWSFYQAGPSLRDIAMLSASDGWAVGQGGKMMRWNGSAWNTFADSVTLDLYYLAMASATSGWAADYMGDSIHWDGSHWISSGAIPAAQPFRGLAAAGSNAYGVSTTVVARWNGSGWTVTYDRISEHNLLFNGIGITPGTDGSEVWVVGKDSGIWRGQNGAWSAVNDAIGRDYMALVFNNPHSGWAFGTRGTASYELPINHWNGTAWASSGTTGGIGYSAAAITPGTNGQDGWVGGWGKAYHWNGASWTGVTILGVESINGISLLSPGEGWAVGGSWNWAVGGSRMVGFILRLHNGDWSVFSKPSDVLNGISMVSPDNGWAVGEGGAMLRWNGTDWATTTSPASNNLRAVVMLSATDGWAAGDDELLYWDGSGSWEKQSLPYSFSIWSMAFASSHNGWAVGLKVMRYDHNGWSIVPAPMLAVSVAMATYRDVWAVGGGTILHYQGPPAALSTNHSIGAPGSFFHITGQSFPPDATAAVTVNGHSLGSVSTGNNGVVAFNLDTGGAAEGIYLVTVQAGEGTALLQFFLQSGQPQHPKEGSDDTFLVLPGIAYHSQYFMPVIAKP